MTELPVYDIDIDTAEDDSWALDIHGDIFALSPGVVITRGLELVRITSPLAASTMKLQLNNRAGTYDPGGAVSKGLPIRARCVYNSITYDLFRGFLEQPLQDPAEWDPRADFTSLGGLNKFVGNKISTQLYSNIRTDEAITHILDAMGWPAGDRDLDTGLTTLDWWWLDDEDAFEALRKLTVSEGPGAHIRDNADGQFIFDNRHKLLTATTSNAVQETFQQLTSPFYAAPEGLLTDSQREVFNECVITVRRRSAKSSSTIWTLGETVVLSANEAISFVARDADGNPFQTAIAPVNVTDYNITAGALTSVVLDRTSGASATITLTATAAGCTFDTLGMRADLVSVDSETEIRNTLAPAPTEPKTYDLEVIQEIPLATAQDFCNAIVSFYQSGRPKFSIEVRNFDATSLVAALSLELDNRIQVDHPSLDGGSIEGWVLEIEDRISQGEHRRRLRCEQATAGNLFGVWGTATWDVSLWGF